MGFMSTLGKLAKAYGPMAMNAIAPGSGTAATAIMGGLGAGLGAASQASATNRGVRIDAGLAEQDRRQTQTRDYTTAYDNRANTVEAQKKRVFDALIEQSKENRASGDNALKNVMHTDYALGAKDYVPPTVTMGGKAVQLPSFGFGPRALSDTAKAGVSSFQQEMMNRLQHGPQMAAPEAAEAYAPITQPTPYTIDPKLLKAGTFEKLGGMLGAGLEGYAAIRGGGGGTTSRTVLPSRRVAGADAIYTGPSLV